MTRHRLVVRPHRPLRNGLIYAALAAVILAMIAGAYQFGQIRAGYDSTLAIQQQNQQNNEIEALTQRNQELRDRIALLERSAEIDKEAAGRLQVNVAAAQDELLKLREELAFYRGIISPQDSVAGLRIQNMRIQASPVENQFRYRLVLIQAVDHDRNVSGKVTMTLRGELRGEDVSLPVADLVTSNADKFEFSFKYFQNLEGDFQLPDGFKPSQLDVVVMPSGRGAEEVSRSFGWQEITG